MRHISLLLRERTLVAAGNVKMCVTKLAAVVDPPLNFVDWTMKNYLG